MKDSTAIPVSECPTCHYRMDRTSAASGEGIPRKGDISVCFKCGAVMQFDENLKMISLGEDALLDLKMKYPKEYGELRKVQSAIGKLTKRN